jgi:peptide/nickel transport system substrate-binding protein
MAASPSEVEVNPGKVTWMTARFGNERFDYTFTAAVGNDYSRLLHGTLISSDVKEGMRMTVPGIATKWDVSSDGLTWTFDIRKGVKFHDGTDLTIDDVLWTLQHAIGPQSREYATSPSSLSLVMDRIEQTGPDQVSVITKSPVSDLPTSISEAAGSLYGIMPKRATLHNVEEELAYDTNPIGAGLMSLTDHVPASVMSFERFDDYYYQPDNGFPDDKRVKFQSFDLFLVPEEATRVAALRTGEADIAPVTLTTKKQVEAGGGRLVFGQEGVTFWVLQLGCWKPEFHCHDRRVRQALAYAIDKEVMRDRLYGAEVMQVKGWSVVTPSTVGYSPEVDPFPFDPDKARQLLAEAGYKTPDNPAGKDFGKLIINTWVSSSMPFLPESAQLAADNWRRVLGLDVEVKVGDSTALKTATLTEELYGQILWRDNETRIDAASGLQGRYWLTGERNQLHSDSELDSMAKNALSVFDPVERENVLRSTYQRLQDEQYEISIGYINIPWGVGPRIQTWEPYPLATYPSALHTITLK